MPGHDPRAGASATRLDSGRNHFLMAASPSDLAIRPYAIWCEAAGTITLTDDNGTSLPYTLEQGASLGFCPVKCTAISAGTFYGIY